MTAHGVGRRYLWWAMNDAGLPSSWRETIWREEERNALKARAEGREELLHVNPDWLTDRIVALRKVARQGVPLDATNHEVAERAKALANECWDSVQREGDDGGARVIVMQHARREWPGLARATCGRWWKRCLNARTDAVTEEAARALGHVGGRSRSYVSEQTHARKISQRRRNQRVVEIASIVDGNGECCDLEVAVKSSVANPEIRRAELMTRIRGSEEVATGHGLVGLMVTTTNASRFHPVRADGTRNALWSGATVRDAHADQLQKWARVRARWAKDGMRVFGLRISEPHKSGTPHWHLLMFVEPGHVRRVVAHILRVFRADDRDIPSRASLRFRVDVELIDTAKGTAASYVAKYVSKNIDGHGLDDGEKSNARRVRSWASAHRIRQFQFFGGPPVGVWREARRVVPGEAERLPELCVLADVVAAVNRRDSEKADWAKFIAANGGIWCKRKDRPVQLDFQPEPEIGAYGEARHCRLYGLRQGSITVETRVRRWRIVWGGIGRKESRTRVNNCNRPGSWRVPFGRLVCLTRFNFIHPGDSWTPEKIRDYHVPDVLYEVQTIKSEQHEQNDQQRQKTEPIQGEGASVEGGKRQMPCDTFRDEGIFKIGMSSCVKLSKQ